MRFGDAQWQEREREWKKIIEPVCSKKEKENFPRRQGQCATLAARTTATTTLISNSSSSSSSSSKFRWRDSVAPPPPPPPFVMIRTGCVLQVHHCLPVLPVLDRVAFEATRAAIVPAPYQPAIFSIVQQTHAVCTPTNCLPFVSAAAAVRWPVQIVWIVCVCVWPMPILLTAVAGQWFSRSLSAIFFSECVCRYRASTVSPSPQFPLLGSLSPLSLSFQKVIILLAVADCSESFVVLLQNCQKLASLTLCDSLTR